MPTLVVQGDADPMKSWRTDEITADAIPGAQFQLYPGVGHNLPREIWLPVLDSLTALATGTTAGKS